MTGGDDEKSDPLSIGEAVLSAFEKVLESNATRGWGGDPFRSSRAKNDEMEEAKRLGFYGEAVREATDVLDLCESPIEQTAIYHLAGRNYNPMGTHPVRAWIMRRVPEHFPTGCQLLLVPQVPAGNFRLDFLFAFQRSAKRLAVECDGQDFHDEARDARRDKILIEDHQISTIRVAGKDIWQGSGWTDSVVYRVASAGAFLQD